MSMQAKRKYPRRSSGVAKLLQTAALAAGGWIIYSKTAVNHNMELPEALPAERKVYFSPVSEKLSYYYDNSAPGRPLVLLHSINAAASAYEMRPLFEHYRSRRPVYALDLPGYGFSDRSDRNYTPWLFQAAIEDFLETQVGQPADVVALSLSSEFAAAAAQAKPGLFHSLALLSPTGLGAEQEQRVEKQNGAGGRSKMLYALFASPLWAQAFFDLIATRASIRYFLAKSFTGPLPDTMVEYAYRSAHQPGAKNVPLHFLSGKLFTPGVRQQVYQRLTIPGLVIYDHDPFTQFDRLPDLLGNSIHWKAVRIIPTCGLAHWEQLPQTSAALDNFWAGE